MINPALFVVVVLLILEHRGRQALARRTLPSRADIYATSTKETSP